MSRIAVDHSSPAVTVTIGDGLRHNALGEADWRHLAAEIEALDRDPEVKVIVIAGRNQMFSAGSDITEWLDADLTDVERSFRAMEDCFTTLEHAQVPVIATVEGNAVGAGCQLALACDLTIASSSSKLGMPIIRLGILPSPAFVERLATRVGSAFTTDLYLTGRLLDANEAQAVGLITRVVSPGTTLAAAQDTATRLQHQPPLPFSWLLIKGLLVARSGMTDAPSRAHDPGGGVTGLGASLDR